MGTYIGMKAANKAPEQTCLYRDWSSFYYINSEVDSLNYTMNEAHQAGNQKDVDKLKLLEDPIKKGEALYP